MHVRLLKDIAVGSPDASRTIVLVSHKLLINKIEGGTAVNDDSGSGSVAIDLWLHDQQIMIRH